MNSAVAEYTIWNLVYFSFKVAAYTHVCKIWCTSSKMAAYTT